MVEHLDTMSIFAGTHNEESTYKLMELMEAKGIQTMMTEFGLVNYME